MELTRLIRAVLRRWWLILALVAITSAALILGLRGTPPTYESQVKLQFTPPQPEDVTLYDQFRSSNTRDEMLVARNNFVELLQSRAAFNRTIAQLHLSGADADYKLDVNALRDADYIYVTVRARAPELASRIASTHVDQTIAYYGELRSRPLEAMRKQIAEQQQVAQQQLQTAEQQLVDFQNRNGITDLEGDISSLQRVIEQLEVDRSRREADGADVFGIRSLEQLLND